MGIPDVIDLSTDAGSDNGNLSIIPYLVARTVDDLTGGTEESLRQPVLLMVEDDDIDAEVLHRLIERLPDRDWKVLRAKTLSAALQILRIEDPDIALVDLNLTDAWHGDTVQAFVEAAPSCPIIVQTGLDDPDIPSEMLRLGAQDFLQKGSITVDTLSRSIRYALARHQTLAQLRSTWVRLAGANEELDDFAHIVAHDLRAPARTARMLNSRLRQELPEDSSELAHELSSRLEQALGYMDDMILSMLDYAGLRNTTPAPAPVDLLDTVTAAVDTIEADLDEIGGSITICIEDDLAVLADEQFLQRVVHNIVGNSVKYRDENRAARILVSAVAVDDAVEIRFKDNGIGVPNGDRERVFGVLERMVHRDVPGLGFGLAICRRIVDSFGGSIWIEPQSPRVGCTMALRLPRHQSGVG